MDRFSELISKGVAKFEYTPIANSIPEQCHVCRSYNNIFSIATDTHMSCLGDKKVITGHGVRDTEKFDKFIWSHQFMGVNFITAGVYSFADWMTKYGLTGHYDILNGDYVYILEPGAFDEEPVEDDIPSTMSFTTVTTDESSIPMSSKYLTTDINDDSIKECIKDTYSETVKSLNESRFVRGNSWKVVNLHEGKHIVGEVSGKIYKF